MRRLGIIMLMELVLLVFGMPVYAQETTDSIVSLDSVPEWYVAPEIPFSLRAPMRAKAAKCTMDSMLSFNVDSVLIETFHYEYDNAGRVISEAVWIVNTDGSQIGKEKKEYAFDAYENQTMTAVYAWDNAANRWYGTEKYEFVYDAEQRMTSKTEYAWVINEWKADKKYTWAYDEKGREKEYFEYKRNTSNNELQYSKGHVQNWDEADRKILDIQYTAAVNNVWSAGTKKEWKFDTDGNQIEYTLYNSISNGNWIGSSKEKWAYNASGIKTYYEKQVWSNGDWVGSLKETWTYGGPTGQLTLHEKYGWENNDWSKTLREETVYTGNNITRIENYTYANEVPTGTKKEEYTYTNGKQTQTIIYAWSDGVWVGSSNEKWVYGGPSGQLTLHEKFTWANTDWSKILKEETEYSGSNVVRIENYTYANGVPTGTKKETTAYSGGKKTEFITYTWTNGDWVNFEKENWTYVSAGMETHEKQVWESGAWVGVEKEIWGYTSNKKTSYEKYLWENGAYVKYDKEVWEYSGSTQTMHATYTGQNDAWVGINKEVWGYTGSKLTLHETYEWYNDDWSMTLREISAFDTDGNQILIENYTGTNGTIKGTKKEEYTFKNTSAGLKQTSKITYTWNATKLEFVGKQWTVSDVDAVGNIIESCKYSYSTVKETWVGSGSRILRTFDSNKNVTDEITQSWSTAITPNGWLNSKRTTNEYEGTNPIRLAIYSWSTALNDWNCTSRSEWTYNAKGQNDSIKNYKLNGTEWYVASRKIMTYDKNGVNILTKSESWKNEKWTMTSMSKVDILYDAVGHQTLNASWTCSSDSIWKGVKKDTAAYSLSNKKIFEGKYESWANGDWIPTYIVEYEYDEKDRETLSQRYDWNDGKKEGRYKYENKYDDQDRAIMTASYLNWNYSTNDWIGTMKYEYVYEGNRIIQQTSYYWGNGQWNNHFLYSYQFDAAGHEIEQLVQFYNNGDWQNSYLYLHAYRGSEVILNNSYEWNSDQWNIFNRYELHYDNDAQHKLRREVTGSWSSGVLVSFSHYYYLYSCDPCVIRFVNYDGTELESKTMDKGQTPVYEGSTPTRPEDIEYTYTFKDWTPEITKVTCSTTYTATFKANKRSYTITWLNDDDTQIDQTTVEYGVMPTHADATKANTAEFTYEFDGWTPGIGIVTGDATYKATFKETKNTYTITWLNDDNSLIGETSVAYGEVPTHADATKANTAEWTYTFTGWDPVPVAVTGATTYKATFNSTKNSYTIIWKDDEGKEIGSDVLAYGETPKHEDLTKENTAEWTYTFSGWTPSIKDVTGDAEYTATFTQTKNKYTVTWQKEDGTEIYNETLEFGADPNYTGTEPTKPADEQYSYRFIGWTPAITTVTANVTYKATFEPIKNSYVILFVDEDGTELQRTEEEYGATPKYNKADPTKAATAQYTYTFDGWDKPIVGVTKDATYRATYKSAVNSYTITWKDDEGKEIGSETLEYGATPQHEDLTKEKTAEWTYTFSGWTPSIKDVTGDAAYTATFTQIKNKYTVTWQKEDGTEIYNETLEFGADPNYTGTEPTKPADEQYSYRFTGWTPAITTVTDNVTYKATFEPIKNSYVILFADEDGTELQRTEEEYGATPKYNKADPTKAATAQYTYTFDGWDKPIVEVTKDATYRATYKSEINKYTITWKDDEGKEIGSETLEYGATPSHADLTKENTAEWTYTFSGWTPSIKDVTGDAAYTATFTQTKNKYTVIWQKEDGTEIYNETLEFGADPNYTGTEPTKPADEQYSYRFTGWDPAITTVTDNVTYKATFEPIKNSYVILFVDEDGTELQRTEEEYGATPKYNKADPTKAATAQYTYTFNGWDKPIAEVTKDEIYRATYKSAVNSYTITWKDDEGKEIGSETLEYGATPQHEDLTKENTAEWTYTFSGWTPSIKDVTGDAAYTATFTQTKNKYTVTWQQENGTEIYHETLEFGADPNYTGTEPTKPADEQYSYRFTGWTPAITTVTGNVTYKATFEPIKNSYVILFVDEDGTELQRTEEEYGVTPKYNKADPTKAATAQYTYTFDGWDKPIVEVTKDATYRATYKSEVNKYTITWKDDEDKEIGSETLEYGATPKHEDLTKENTAEWTYTFSGWTPSIKDVTGDAAYTATFTQTKNKYTIIFKNEDGTELQKSEVEYGVVPSCTEPTKQATEEYTYTFTGWSPQVVAVTEEATYTATFSETKSTFTITWNDDEGNLIDLTTVNAGEVPTHDDPSKENTAEWTYTFKGWDPNVVEASADATYQATFSKTKNQYLITWLNDDGSELFHEKLEYGATPAHADIYKESTDKYTYTFAGWDPQIVPVTGDATYTATFDSTEIIITYHITVTTDDAEHGKAGFVYADSNTSTLLTEDDVPSGTWIELRAIPADNWHFVEWNDGDTASVRQIEVTADAQYVASFEPNCGDYPTLPVVSLYDWLLMLDVRSIHAMGYVFEEEDVTWYRVHGEPDKLDDGNNADDERLGTGYSFSLNESLANTGDYYASVDVSSSPVGVPCTDMMRSQIVHFASTKANASPMLAPVLVHPNEPQQVHSLNPDAPTTITIYDISGQLIRTISDEGVDRMNLQAEGVAGCYQVVIQNGDHQTVLRYIVVQ